MGCEITKPFVEFGLWSVSAMASAELSSTHRYGAGGLFALALRQAQLQQRSKNGFGSPLVVHPPGDGASKLSKNDGELPWTSQQTGLLRNIFRYLEIDEKEWAGLESASVSTEAKDHILKFLNILSTDDEESKKLSKDEASLAKAVDAAVEEAKKKLDVIPKYKTEESRSEVEHNTCEDIDGWDLSEAKSVSKERRVTVIYTLLAACISHPLEEVDEMSKDDSSGSSERDSMKSAKTGYDARKRVALRLLARWFDIEWIAAGAMELIVAHVAMATEKEFEKKHEKGGKKSKWKKWKRGGLIGAAAVTGGALLAVTGGLAAPAVAAGMEAVAAAVPILGASGLTAAASVAGSGAAGSTAVAASFGVAGAGMTGKKMAKRTGDVDEFEFDKLGNNHQQGRLAVEIVVSGIAFQPEDFVKPWETPDGDLERYALRWESEHVFAVSTAVQDWLKSTATQQAIKQGAMYTVLGGLVTAMATPLAVLGATNMIDSKWGMAIDRSEKTGILLATILLQNVQGSR